MEAEEAQRVDGAPAAVDAQQQDETQAEDGDASGDTTAAAAQFDEQHEPVRDDFLDVVVTSVDACEGSSGIGAGSASGVVASALSVSSSLLMGSQEYLVELVVTKGSGSYCIRRPLSELLAVLQLPDQLPSSALASIPVFPPKQSKNDALIAQWCGEMTSFLAVQCSELRTLPKWMEFIEESNHGIGNRAHMTAVEFILQPFQYEKVR
uniref:Uncharacterized protein n=1 Tax=Globisporangium ultimum (strain ATCC 200006 / CBS 805.95 / DAOM BR144) TaxID=431595 RepID=K3WL56_GLOUD